MSRRAALVLVFLLGAAGSARAGALEDCGQIDDVERTIRGCGRTLAIFRQNDIRFRAYENLGMAFLKKSDFPAAIENLNKAAKIDPDAASAYYHRAYAYESLDDKARALTDYTRAIELQPTVPDYYIARGQLKATGGDHSGAASDFSEYIRLTPDRAHAFFRRGYAYLKMRDFYLAITDFTRALAIDPGLFSVYINRAEAFAELNEYDRAVADVSQFIAKQPNVAVGYYFRAICYDSMGRYDEAITDFKRGLDLQPTADGYTNLGIVLRQKNDFDRAEAAFTQALSIDPRFQKALWSRGTLRWSKERPQDALADLRTARQIDPTKHGPEFALARVLFELGDYRSAAEAFSREIAAGYETARATLYLYLAQSRLGLDAGPDLEVSAARFGVDNSLKPIFDLYLNRVTPSETVAAAVGVYQRCEYLYYVAQWHLSYKMLSEARATLRRAVDTCREEQFEYGAVRVALKRLNE